MGFLISEGRFEVVIKKFLKDKKIDILCNCLFILTYLLVIIIMCRFGKFILGSTTDFDVQHYLIPDYFRTLFYKTHDILPDFAFNLGAGQNIYYLSYYGLFNPIILLSYFFPNVSMLNYIMVAMSIVVVSSTSLFYFYLRKNGYSYLVSFLSGFMLLCAAPFIFHSHRHIMFMDYMPFLIMGFYGIDKFLSKKKSGLLILSIVLMIFTSYYYSISGMLVLFILGIYKYVRSSKFKVKEFLGFGFKLALRFIVSVLISAVLILPTLYTLLNGRSDSSSLINILSLLKPSMYLLYSDYSVGLTLISLVGIVYAILKGDKANRFLGIILLIVSISPLIVYVLNGFLYVNAKVLIPFIPLVLLITSEFMIKISKKRWSKFLLASYVTFTSLAVCLIANFSDRLISSDSIKSDLNANYSSSIEEIIAKDDIYRINTSNIDKPYINKVFYSLEYKTTMYSSAFNNNYRELFIRTFQNPLSYRNKFMITASDNLLFQMYMGEKYIFTPVKYNSIYEEISKKGTINIYKNNYVLPIGYATDKVVSKNQFESMRYPDNIINMLGRVVVDGKTNVDTLKTSDILLDYDVISSEGVEAVKKDDGYTVTATNKGKVKIKVKNVLQDKLLFIGFDLESKNTDLAITLNGITNKLTNKNWKYYNENTNFNYTLVGDEVIEISFTKGVYDISDILVSTIDFDKIKDVNKSVDSFIIDKEETKGDYIKGKIDVTSEEAYFTTSIPYDKGFTIFVDGKETDYFKINGGFIGFNIARGSHEVTISFKAPYKDIGLVISLIGVISSFVIIYLERRKKEVL